MEARPSALEHMTGPSRGRVVWLGGEALDVHLGPDRMLRISAAEPGEVNGEPDGDLIARLRRADGSYEIVASEDRPIWVNGVRVIAQRLQHLDMIEFGTAGPLSRFRLDGEGLLVRKVIGDFLSDGLAYLRVSRQPVARRVVVAVSRVLSGLARETTLLFRLGVLAAIAVLAALVYQQHQLNTLLQQRVEGGAQSLERVALALARARDEALTPGDLTALRQEFGQRLSSTAERLSALEWRSQASARVIAGALSSVVFLQGAYGIRERASGRMLRILVDGEGLPVISPLGQPLLTLDGQGPIAERQFTGTGFAVGAGNALVTNRHVARPWEDDAIVEALTAEGLEPVMTRYIAYAPGQATANTVQVVTVGADADLAVLRRVDGGAPLKGLALADAPPARGDEVIVLGYPTGLKTMLAQSGEAFVEELEKVADIGFWKVAALLAEKGLIVPLASRGIVSQTTPVTMVYDAETTHGGSGGPVLDVDGKVVAVNAAVLPEFGGSNLGVPVAKVRALLESAGLH